MEHHILSTKGAGRKYLVSKLIGDIIFAGIGFFFLSKVETLQNNWQFSLAETASKSATVFFLLALLFATYHIMIATTVAELYDDKIVGKGLQKIMLKDFHLRFEQITEIATTKGVLMETATCVFLAINTASGEYKVLATPEAAAKIRDHFNATRK